MGENETVDTRTLSEVIAEGFDREMAAEVDTPAESVDTGTDTAVGEDASGENMETGATGEALPDAGSAPIESQAADIPAEEASADPRDALIAELRAQNAQMVGQFQQLMQAMQSQQTAVQEQSALAEEAVNEAAGITIPRINVRELSYMSDEDAARAMDEWQNAVMQAASEQALRTVQEDISPIKADYEQKARDAAILSAKETIYNDARFSDFREHDGSIDRLLSQIPEFSSMDPGKARMLGGLIDRGMRNDPNKTMSSDELVQAVLANPDAMKALELRRAQNINEKTAELPKLSASQGMSGAAPVPEHRPQNMDELKAHILRKYSK